jgi:hypothetical protein
MAANLSDVEREIERVSKQLAQLKVAAAVLRNIEVRKALLARKLAPPVAAQPEAAADGRATLGREPPPGRLLSDPPNEGTDCAGMSAARAAYLSLKKIGRRSHYKEIAAKAMRNGFRTNDNAAVVATTIRRSMGKNPQHFRQVGSGVVELVADHEGRLNGDQRRST